MNKIKITFFDSVFSSDVIKKDVKIISEDNLSPYTIIKNVFNVKTTPIFITVCRHKCNESMVFEKRFVKAIEVY